MPKPPSKETALRDTATFNPRADQVDDPLFAAHEFFDPSDLLQVKYEMLRRVRGEGLPISDAAARFGFSRPSFYKANTAFEAGGLAALIARKRGPKGAHKLTGDVMERVTELIVEEPRPTLAEIQQALEAQFGLRIHRRSLQRALRRQEKKR